MHDHHIALKKARYLSLKVTHMAELKLVFAHFREHSAFIGRIYPAIIVVHDSTYADSRGTHQVKAQ